MVSRVAVELRESLSQKPTKYFPFRGVAIEVDRFAARNVHLAGIQRFAVATFVALALLIAGVGVAFLSAFE
jgi:hypothetical protein